MTEAEWLACTDPPPMLAFLRGKATDRKLRLFAVGCCRLIWDRMMDERSRNAVETAERFADGAVHLNDLVSAGQRARSADEWTWRKWEEEVYHAAALVTRESAEAAAGMVAVQASIAHQTFPDMLWRTRSREMDSSQAALLRCIFGNPFRPIAAGSAWRTSTALGLSSAIYAERAFDRLPILADALEDASCDNADVLAHCRGDGPHVRGCWVVDLILSKE